MERPGAVRRGIRFAHKLSTGAAALLLVLGSGFRSHPAFAQSDTEYVVIQAVSLRQTPDGAEIEIAADEAPRWTIRYDKTGGFVLRMPGSVIGREIPDLESAEGPIAEVRLQQVTDPVAPYTLLSVVARERVRVSVRPAGTSLKVLLDPLTTAPETTPEVEAPATSETTSGPEMAPAASPPAAAKAPEALEEPPSAPEGEALPSAPSASPEAPEPELQEELELLREERDALALGSPAYAVMARAQPCLYLRSAPDGRELDCVDSGTRLTLLGLEGAWARVRVDDRLDAWARFEYLEPAPALPSSPGEKSLQDRLARLGAELSGLREENLELREAASTAQESLERAWEAQQNLSARLVEMQTGGADSGAEIERLSEAVERLRAENADLTAEIERDREAASAAERDADQRLEAATAERDELAHQLDQSRNAMALGGSTFVVLPTAEPCLNLRAEPGAASRLDCLAPGTRVALLELRGEWARARSPQGVVGWLAHAFVEPAPATPDEVRQLNEARARIYELERSSQAERAAHDQRLSEAETEGARLLTELRATAAAAAVAHQSQLEALQTRLAASDSQLAGAQQQITELEAAVEELRTTAARDTAETDRTIEALRAAAADAENNALALTAAEERVATARAELDALAAELADSRAASAAAETRAADLETRLASVSAAGDRRIAELETELETFRIRLNETTAETAATTERASTAEAEIEALRIRLEESASELAVANERGSRLEEELAVARAATSERQAEADAELETLRDRAARSDTAIAAAQAHVAQLERELEAARTAAGESRTAAEAEIVALRDRAASAEAADSEARGRLDDLEQQVGTWKAKAAENTSLRAELERAKDAQAAANAEARAAREAMELGSSTYVVRDTVDPCLNLRAKPGDGAPVDCLAPATRLTLLEASQEWARARLENGLEGWLARSFIEASPTSAAEVESLRAELVELEESSATASALAAQAESRAQVLTSRLEDERSERARLEGELQTALARAAVARSENEVSTEGIRRELEASRAEVARLTTALEEARAAAESARREAGSSAAAETRIVELSDELAAEIEATVPPIDPAPDTNSIEARTLALEWARAWSEQRVDDYLAFYSERFEAPDGLTREQWADQRRRRLTAPSFIEVGLTDIETRAREAGELLVEFTQAYRSNTFNDRIRKSLTLIREGDGWKILHELSR